MHSSYQALNFFDQLTSDDAQWLFANGTEQQVISKTMLIKAGERPGKIFVVLQGLFDVVSDTLNERIATLGPGDIFGEMSFLEDSPASAHVIARENSLVMSLSRQNLEERMAEDTGFAARFYRAVAILISNRLRNSVGMVEGVLDKLRKPATDHTDNALGQQLQELITQMKELLADTDRKALQNGGEVPKERVQEVRTAFTAFVERLNTLLGDEETCDAATAARLGRWVQNEMMPYVMTATLADRMYSKPRGYAGDYLTIEYMYRNEAQGVGRVGPLIDRCFLDQAAAKAAQNRRPLLAEEIRAVIDARPSGVPARVTSLASGPAAELFDVFDQLDDKSMLEATCVDIDLQALAFVADKRDQKRLKTRIRLENENIVYLADGRSQLRLEPQDLVYSVGLIDYFSDRFVIKLLNYIHSILRQGGQVIVGNFHPRNPSKAMMDHVLDWPLIHRTEDDMNRLFEASAFGRPCERIRYEQQRVNLFAVGVKN